MMAASHWWAEETASFMHAAMIAYGKLEVAIKMRLAELYSGSDPGPVGAIITTTIVSTGQVIRHAIPPHAQKLRREQDKRRRRPRRRK